MYINSCCYCFSCTTTGLNKRFLGAEGPHLRHGARDAGEVACGQLSRFIGWSNSHFNSLRFIISLETNSRYTFQTHNDYFFCESLKKVGC